MCPVDFWQGRKGIGWQQVVLGALNKHQLINKPQSSFMPYVRMTSVNHAFKYKIQRLRLTEENWISRGCSVCWRTLRLEHLKHSPYKNTVGLKGLNVFGLWMTLV